MFDTTIKSQSYSNFRFIDIKPLVTSGCRLFTEKASKQKILALTSHSYNKQKYKITDMNHQKINIESRQLLEEPQFQVFPSLSVNYGSAYGNRRTEEENRLVIQMDRLLTIFHCN